MSVEHLQGKRILLTGATGFLGQHLLQQLEPLVASHKIKVSCVVRATSNRTLLPSFVNIYEADLDSGLGLDKALEGQDIVIHMAAVLFGTCWKEYFANVRMAKALGKAMAKQESIEKVLFVSSLAATGPSSAQGVVDDNSISAPVSAYGWSKSMAEEVLYRYCQDKVVVVRPPIIYGPADKGLLPFFQAVQMGLIISPGFGRDFPVSTIYVGDMVKAMFCALKPQASGIYHCNDGHSTKTYEKSHTMRGIGQIIASALEKRTITLKLPLCILGISAYISTLWGAVSSCLCCCASKRKPSWNKDKYREAKAYGWECDGTRMQNELGFTPEKSLQSGLEETIADYKKRGWLR